LHCGQIASTSKKKAFFCARILERQHHRRSIKKKEDTALPRISLVDIEVAGEFKRLKEKKLQSSNSKFIEALRKDQERIFCDLDQKRQQIMNPMKDLLKKMQSKLEILFMEAK